MALRFAFLLHASILLTAPVHAEDARTIEFLHRSETPVPQTVDGSGLVLPPLPEITEAQVQISASPHKDEEKLPASISAKPASALALIDRPASEHESPAEPNLVLPAVPEVTLVFEAPANSGVLAEMPVELDLPRLPEVSVSIASELMMQPLDEGEFRRALEAVQVRLKLRAGTVEDILAAYAERRFSPLWLGVDGTALPKVAALRHVLDGAAVDGLDPKRLLAAFPDLRGTSVAREEREAAEAGLSIAALLYAQDARGGRIDPVRLSSLLTPKLFLPDIALLIDRLAPAKADIGAILASYQPPHAGYRALRDRLATLREAMEEPETTASTLSPEDAALRALPGGFMEGGLIVPGASDARVPALRVRLKLPAVKGQLYDEALAEAVKTFQRANGLVANGRITSRSRLALENRAAPLASAVRKPDPNAMIGTLIANMERWRWLPPELGETYIFVNVPEFRLDMVSAGRSVFNTRVIVGKPETQTPIFSDQMEFLIVNPSWFVPPSIMKNEFLPRMAADPDYAAKKGYEVIRRGKAISVRQPPGERNALGHIKFMFPNQHAVYLHDTPGRHLFGAQARAFSHGCIRVEGPFRLAEEILLAKQGFTEKALRTMIGHGERMIRLNQQVPVHLVYFTLNVDQNGQTISHVDLYGHDARLRKALAL